MDVVVDDEVLALGLNVCVARLAGLSLKKSTPAIRALKKEIAAHVKADKPLEAVAVNENILGFRELYAKVGAGGDGLTPSCEALVGMIHKSGALPTINTLVDLYNAISCRHLMTIGAHDREQIVGTVRVGITRGNERFVPLFATEAERVRAGEYAYMDDEDILCRLDVRQCHKTRIELGTTEAYVVSNNNPRIEKSDLVDASQEVCDLARELLGAEAEIVGVF